MARMWMPGAATLPSPRDGGSMVGGPARATEHVMVTPYTWSALQAARFLVQQGTEAHLTCHPISGQAVQMIPANRAARALANPAGGVQTNRQGSVNIQTEWVAMPDGFDTDLTDAGKRLVAARANWLDSLGVDRVVGGSNPPAQTYAQANARGHRSTSRWLNSGGYFNHSDVPENLHWDTAVRDMRRVMGKRGGGAQDVPVIVLPDVGRDTAGAEWFAPDDLSVSTIKALQRAVGVKADGIMGPKTAKATQEWLGVAVDGWWGRKTVSALQRKVGSTQDGIWGPKTAAALRRYLDRDADGGDDLAVDGILGANTVRALQRWVGTRVDGVMGRNTKRALQRKLRVTADGIVGPNTIRALQRKVDAPVDGAWGPNTTRHLQRFLNRVL